MTKHIQWDGQLSQEGFDILKGEGGCIVCPTKVGYIIMTSDKAGLERKFEAKERNRNKPGVVLCGSMDELRALAQLNPEIEAFYQKHWDEDILLGCILPWREDAYAKLQAFGDGREELHALSSNLVKLGSKSPKKCGKKKARWYTPLQLTLPVKETAGRSKESVSVSKVPWTWLSKPMIM